ncbi:MAG: hypothetical protein AB1305_01465 [Candidatus Hadarchaeota archaeon]
MDDAQFFLVYSVTAGLVLEASLFMMSRGLDRKRYLGPVVAGVVFGGGSVILFRAWLLSYLLGGVLTGYFLSRHVAAGWSHFRAGAVNGLLLEAGLILSNAATLVIKGVTPILSTLSQTLGRTVAIEELLSSLTIATVLDIFFIIAVVGSGAMLGGMLRKLISPATVARPAQTNHKT